MGTFHVILERLYKLQKCSKNVSGENSANQKSKIKEVLFINISYLYRIFCSRSYTKFRSLHASNICILKLLAKLVFRFVAEAKYRLKISIVLSNRTKYLSMLYVSATRLVVELARGTSCCKTNTDWRLRTDGFASERFIFTKPGQSLEVNRLYQNLYRLDEMILRIIL